MNRIVTISFTPLDAPGGVPKFNRDLHAAFPDRECVHFSWWDFPWYIEMEGLPEWEKARTLNHYLVQSRKLLPTDVVVADGFWADGLQHLKHAISHSHGIWSHLTLEDVQAKKPPDMPLHHSQQVTFRRRWLDLGKHMTAVSDFIANEMRRQWNYDSHVINNGVDTEEFRPAEPGLTCPSSRPVIVHGVNDKGNLNKGWDHIELLKKEVDAEVLSLDELMFRWKFHGQTKAKTLAGATICVHPSGYEGNSMFVAEALSCGLPVVGYDVGFLWSVQNMLGTCVMDRKNRSPQTTVDYVKRLLEAPDLLPTMGMVSREIATSRLSKEIFARNWRLYVQEVEDGLHDL